MPRVLLMPLQVLALCSHPWSFCCSGHHVFEPVVRTRESSHLEMVDLLKYLLLVWMDLSEMRFYQFCSTILTPVWKLQWPHLFLPPHCGWRTMMCLLVIITVIPKTVSSLLVSLPAFCQDDELECANHECVSRDRWCDGEVDCVDSSDEWDCGELPVSPICSVSWRLSSHLGWMILNGFTDLTNQVHLFFFTLIKADSGDSYMLFPSHRTLRLKLLLSLRCLWYMWIYLGSDF